MNFENLNIGFHFFYYIFYEDKKLIAISSIKCLNFKFFCYKIMHKK